MAGKAGSRLSMEIAVTAIISAMMATNSAKPGPDQGRGARTSWTGGTGRIAMVTAGSRDAMGQADQGSSFAAQL
ncbi:hypothetical protein ACU4GA_17490 [Methylobacterium oryzae CBMB20]